MDKIAKEFCNHGEKLYTLGEVQEAEAAFRKAIEKDPNCIEAYNNLGVLYSEQSTLEQGLEFFRKALQLNPKHPDTLANIQALMQNFHSNQTVDDANQKFSNKKTLVVMGNGPSIKAINLKLLNYFETFSLNAAYRMYEQLKWWPIYHGCFDYVVTKSHRTEYKKLVEGNNLIKRFFYLEALSDSPRLQKITLLPYKSTDKWNQSEADFASFADGGNSGVNACQVGVCLGYKKILLVGVDCNYTEIIEGAKINHEGRLVIEKTPATNPNYWFDDYQREGDTFNVPQTDRFHLPAWERFAQRAAQHGIEVLNCSPGSKLKCFKTSTLEQHVMLTASIKP